MISRHWRGIAHADRADDYERHLLAETLPALRRIRGFVEASMHRRPVEEGVEFLVVTQWRSMAAIEQFAGPDPEAAVVPDAVRAMMVTYDDRARHYASKTGLVATQLVELANRAFARLAGVVLAAFGVAIAGVLVAFLGGIGRTDRLWELLLLLMLLAVVGAFCIVVGTRLALNRPNRAGSALSPRAWIAMAVLFAFVPVVLIAIALSGGPPGAVPAIMAAIVLFGLVAARAWKVRQAGKM